MCGIVGYVGKQQGGAHHPGGPEAPGIPGLRLRRARPCSQDGRLTSSRRRAGSSGWSRRRPGTSFTGTTGIGHTRWATHGGVTDANAHPHVSSDGKFALIHNGVIENYSQMKAFLAGQGLHLQVRDRHRGPLQPDRLPLRQGASGGERARAASWRACARPCATSRAPTGSRSSAWSAPGEIVAARKASPLILGVGRRRVHPGERRLGPDQPHPERRLPEGRGDRPPDARRPSRSRPWTRRTFRRSSTGSPGRWRTPSSATTAHFMEKEIFEQPQALENTMRGRFSEDGSTAQFGGLNMTPAEFAPDRPRSCSAPAAPPGTPASWPST